MSLVQHFARRGAVIGFLMGAFLGGSGYFASTSREGGLDIAALGRAVLGSGFGYLLLGAVAGLGLGAVISFFRKGGL